ncbi:zinc finger C2HC domain-containing protein 1B-like [Tachypleus tridentatus]|uniref:zinc finger C2HC domain-containing protein 1B-like n=1 Tax=Tachypleus tridentatus TaxID=6853 RepID=UPI003FCF73FA
MKQKDATFVATIKEQQTEMKKMTLNKKAPIPKGPVLIKRMNSLPNSLNEKTQVIDPSQLRFNLVACSICNRTFAKDRIKKHSGICRKTTQKRRKVFDATKMRVKGTEAENFVKGKPKKDDQKPPKNNWRIKHETLIASIRQAKVIQQHVAAGGKLSDLPPPPTVENPDYIPCPYCNRTFSQAAADRHIPKCKNIISNKKTKV